MLSKANSKWDKFCCSSIRDGRFDSPGECTQQNMNNSIGKTLDFSIVHVGTYSGKFFKIRTNDRYPQVKAYMRNQGK